MAENLELTNEREIWGRWLTMSDIAGLPDNEFLVEGLIARHAKQAIVGEPGAGKTFVALDLAVAIASGRDYFAGHFKVNGPAKVVYCGGEKIRGLKRRIAAATQGLSSAQKKAAEESLQIFTGVPRLFDKASTGRRALPVEAFMAGCKENVGDVDLVIVDTWHKATIGADENDVRDTGKALEAADELVDKLGCSLLLVHHTPKLNPRDLRGHSALKADLESVMIVLKRKSGGILDCGKSSEASEHSPLGFDLVPMPIADSCSVRWTGIRSRRTVASEDRNASVLAALGDGQPATVQGLASKLKDTGFTLGAVRRSLSALVEFGHVDTVVGGGRGKETVFSLAKPKPAKPAH
jgi:hypothetical protein